MGIVRIAGQSAATLYGILSPREDSHTVPASLSLPHRAISGRLDGGERKGALFRLQLLQADDVRLTFR